MLGTHPVEFYTYEQQQQNKSRNYCNGKYIKMQDSVYLFIFFSLNILIIYKCFNVW